MQRKKFIANATLVAAGSWLIPSFLKAESFDKGVVESIISANATGKNLEHFWSKCVGAGRANEGLRATWLEHLHLSKTQCGFQYCRFHGLFHDDMCVYKEDKGKIIYNWQYIDDLFDRMLDHGVKPFVELGFMPITLASDITKTQFWWKAQISPPNDFGKWAALVSEFTKHCIQRYGITEVRSWYFEVWNEPNLNGFWSGTKSQYFELYKVSVNAIKAIDQGLRVGGPSTSNFVPDDRFAGEKEDRTRHKTHSVPDLNMLDWKGVWIEDFLKYCDDEKLPVDFVSCHPYPTDWALDPMTGKGGDGVRKVGATREDLQWLNGIVKSSAYPDAEIHLTEWSSSPSPRDPTHDSLPAATYVIKANLDCIGLTHSLSYWVFTDLFEEKGAGDSIWHGGFGMINYQGIVKPVFHAYRMLHALGDEVLKQEDGMVITRHSLTKKITALLYHYPKEVHNVVKGSTEGLLETGSTQKFKLQIDSLQKQAKVVIETLDKNHGYAYAAWKKMGSPEQPTHEQTKQLTAAGFATKKETSKTDAKGKYLFERTLQPWDCVLVQIG